MKTFMAGLIMAAIAAVSYAQTGLQYPDEMISAAIGGDEAKVLETKARVDMAEKPPRGDRKSARALNTKALADISAGNIDGAIESLTKAAEADPLDAEIPSNLGYAYIKKGTYDKAKSALARSLSLQPGRGSAWATLAEAFARSGNIETAAACFNIAYTFSQNRDKTKEFLSKIIADNEDANLVAAAKSALESEGIKPLRKADPSTQTQQVQVPAEPDSSSTPAASPAPAPAQEAIAQPSAAAPQVAPEPVHSAPSPNTEAAGTASISTNNMNYFIRGAVLIVLAALAFFGYRKVKAVREASAAREGASTLQLGALKKVLPGLAALGIGFGGWNFAFGEKQLAVTADNLAGFWNCSMDVGTTYIMSLPSAADIEQGKGGGATLVTQQGQDGTIIQTVSSFKYSVDGDVVSMKNVGVILSGRRANDEKFIRLSVSQDNSRFQPQIPHLTKRGMIFLLSEGYGWRACNRIDGKVAGKLAFDVDGVAADRAGQPDLKKFLGSHPEFELKR